MSARSTTRVQLQLKSFRGCPILLDYRAVWGHGACVMETSPFTPEGELALNAFLIGLKTKGLLTDEFLPASEGEIILNKPFVEWPRELQEKMAPHGAGPAIR